MKVFAPLAALGLGLALGGLAGGIAPALAQAAAPPPMAAPPGPPPEQRCGGLLCDAGIIQGGRDPAFGPARECGFFCRLTGGGPAADAAAP